MQIFIKVDENRQLANKTRIKIVDVCEKLSVKITDNPEKADLICSIGGDGTFLESSRLSKGIPLLGINCGTLGYLTDVNPEEVNEAINNMVNNNYFLEERMMLNGEIIKENNEIVKIPSALNDVTISKNGYGIIRFDVIVDGKLINSYAADGIIICTPTGSTAYNLSCGGPIVDPNAQIITLTPISPHTILNRSIILSDDSVVEIKIKEIRSNDSSYVLYDGKPLKIAENDTIRVYKSKQISKIIKFNRLSFIDNIRNTIK